MIAPRELDFALSPRPDIGNDILSAARNVFEEVRQVPLDLRRNLPGILQTNNFGFAVRVTKDYAFLEVSRKSRASPAHDRERLEVYRKIFVPQEANRPAMFAIDQARFVQVSGMTLQGTAPAFALGRDASLCVADVRVEMQGFRGSIDLLYVVGFGPHIRPEAAWIEFDALLRVSLANFAKQR